jgi:hypothetical protein
MPQTRGVKEDEVMQVRCTCGEDCDPHPDIPYRDICVACGKPIVSGEVERRQTCEVEGGLLEVLGDQRLAIVTEAGESDKSLSVSEDN